MFVLRLFCFIFFLFFTNTYAFKSPSANAKPAKTAKKTVPTQKLESFTASTDNDLNLKHSIEKPGGLFDGNVLDMYPKYYYKKQDEQAKRKQVRQALDQSDFIEIEPLEEILPSYILTEIENAKAQKVKEDKDSQAKITVANDIKWAKRSENIFILKTDVGDVSIELDAKGAPNTVAEIKKLMIDGFYSNMLFFRVIPQFLVQTGDPSNTGFGGEMLKAKDEFSKDERMIRGTVAVANKGYSNSQSSQFFILLNNASWLNGKYTVIGHVIEGMEVLDQVKTGNSKVNGLVEKPSRIYAIDWYYDEVQKKIRQQKNAKIANKSQATPANNGGGAAQNSNPLLKSGANNATKANNDANNNGADGNNNPPPAQ